MHANLFYKKQLFVVNLPFDIFMLEQTDVPCLLNSCVLGCTIAKIANVHVNVDMTFY